jgi:hypothetical protein
MKDLPDSSCKIRFPFFVGQDSAIQGLKLPVVILYHRTAAYSPQKTGLFEMNQITAHRIDRYMIE